jgi:large subunit ribosomal protein L32
MAVVQIKKMSKRRSLTRRANAHGKVEVIKQLAKCSNCGTKVLPHVVCHNCGYYKGKKVLNKLV